MKAEVRPSRFKRWGARVLVFVCGALVGFAVKATQDRQASVSSQDIEVHQGLQNFINPLLSCKSPDNIQTLESQPLKSTLQGIIKNSIAQHRADKVSVYFRDLTDGQWVGIGQDDMYDAASLIKVPIMMTYFKMAESDPTILQQRVTYTGGPDLNALEQIRPPTSTPLQVGQSYSVLDLISRMIVNSGNNATALLLQGIDNDLFKETFTDLGVPFEYNPQSQFSISARMYSHFFRILYNSTYLVPNLSNDALGLLSQTTFKDGLVAGVPSDVKVAHKFGERESAPGAAVNAPQELHDCGIVYHPKRPYFICVMTQGRTLQDLEGVIKQLSQATYESVDRNEQK